jgi:energy-coupling factor transporter ATP-binding protein EcfA2
MNKHIRNFNEMIIPHQQFQKALKELNSRLAHHKNGLKGGITLTGDSGSGKTTVLEHFESLHPVQHLPSGKLRPVMRITVPANPTMKNLASQLLFALDASEGKAQESEAMKTHRLVTVLKNCGVKMVIFEEFQHLIERGDKKIVHTADWLKNLIGEAGIIAIVSGLKTSTQVFSHNDQLKRRFNHHIHFGKFDWNMAAQRREFIAILRSFEEALAPIDIPEISTGPLAFCIHVATDGMICHVKQLLAEALMKAYEERRTEISITDIAETWEAIFGLSNQNISNPFQSLLSQDSLTH